MEAERPSPKDQHVPSLTDEKEDKSESIAAKQKPVESAANAPASFLGSPTRSSNGTEDESGGKIVKFFASKRRNSSSSGEKGSPTSPKTGDSVSVYTFSEEESPPKPLRKRPYRKKGVSKKNALPKNFRRNIPILPKPSPDSPFSGQQISQTVAVAKNPRKAEMSRWEKKKEDTELDRDRKKKSIIMRKWPRRPTPSPVLVDLGESGSTSHEGVRPFVPTVKPTRQTALRVYTRKRKTADSLALFDTVHIGTNEEEFPLDVLRAESLEREEITIVSAVEPSDDDQAERSPKADFDKNIDDVVSALIGLGGAAPFSSPDNAGSRSASLSQSETLTEVRVDLPAQIADCGEAESVKALNHTANLALAHPPVSSGIAASEETARSSSGTASPPIVSVTPFGTVSRGEEVAETVGSVDADATISLTGTKVDSTKAEVSREKETLPPQPSSRTLRGDPNPSSIPQMLTELGEDKAACSSSALNPKSITGAMSPEAGNEQSDSAEPGLLTSIGKASTPRRLRARTRTKSGSSPTRSKTECLLKEAPIPAQSANATSETPRTRTRTKSSSSASDTKPSPVSYHEADSATSDVVNVNARTRAKSAGKAASSKQNGDRIKPQPADDEITSVPLEAETPRQEATVKKKVMTPGKKRSAYEPNAEAQADVRTPGRRSISTTKSNESALIPLADSRTRKNKTVTDDKVAVAKTDAQLDVGPYRRRSGRNHVEDPQTTTDSHPSKDNKADTTWPGLVLIVSGNHDGVEEVVEAEEPPVTDEKPAEGIPMASSRRSRKQDLSKQSLRAEETPLMVHRLEAENEPVQRSGSRKRRVNSLNGPGRQGEPSQRKGRNKKEPPNKRAAKKKSLSMEGLELSQSIRMNSLKSGGQDRESNTAASPAERSTITKSLVSEGGEIPHTQPLAEEPTTSSNQRSTTKPVVSQGFVVLPTGPVSEESLESKKSSMKQVRKSISMDQDVSEAPIIGKGEEFFASTQIPKEIRTRSNSATERSLSNTPESTGGQLSPSVEKREKSLPRDEEQGSKRKSTSSESSDGTASDLALALYGELTEVQYPTPRKMLPKNGVTRGKGKGDLENLKEGGEPSPLDKSENATDCALDNVFKVPKVPLFTSAERLKRKKLSKTTNTVAAVLKNHPITNTAAAVNKNHPTITVHPKPKKLKFRTGPFSRNAYRKHRRRASKLKKMAVTEVAILPKLPVIQPEIHIENGVVVARKSAPPVLKVEVALVVPTPQAVTSEKINRPTQAATKGEPNLPRHKPEAAVEDHESMDTMPTLLPPSRPTRSSQRFVPAPELPIEPEITMPVLSPPSPVKLRESPKVRGKKSVSNLESETLGEELELKLGGVDPPLPVLEPVSVVSGAAKNKSRGRSRSKLCDDTVVRCTEDETREESFDLHTLRRKSGRSKSTGTQEGIALEESAKSSNDLLQFINKDTPENVDDGPAFSRISRSSRSKAAQDENPKAVDDVDSENPTASVGSASGIATTQRRSRSRSHLSTMTTEDTLPMEDSAVLSESTATDIDSSQLVRTRTKMGTDQPANVSAIQGSDQGPDMGKRKSSRLRHPMGDKPDQVPSSDSPMLEASAVSHTMRSSKIRLSVSPSPSGPPLRSRSLKMGMKSGASPSDSPLNLNRSSSEEARKSQRSTAAASSTPQKDQRAPLTESLEEPKGNKKRERKKTELSVEREIPKVSKGETLEPMDNEDKSGEEDGRTENDQTSKKGKKAMRKARLVPSELRKSSRRSETSKISDDHVLPETDHTREMHSGETLVSPESSNTQKTDLAVIAESSAELPAKRIEEATTESIRIPQNSENIVDVISAKVSAERLVEELATVAKSPSVEGTSTVAKHIRTEQELEAECSVECKLTTTNECTVESATAANHCITEDSHPGAGMQADSVMDETTVQQKERVDTSPLQAVISVNLTARDLYTHVSRGLDTSEEEDEIMLRIDSPEIVRNTKEEAGTTSEPPLLIEDSPQDRSPVQLAVDPVATTSVCPNPLPQSVDTHTDRLSPTHRQLFKQAEDGSELVGSRDVLAVALENPEEIVCTSPLGGRKAEKRVPETFVDVRLDLADHHASKTASQRKVSPLDVSPLSGFDAKDSNAVVQQTSEANLSLGQNTSVESLPELMDLPRNATQEHVLGPESSVATGTTATCPEAETRVSPLFDRMGEGVSLAETSLPGSDKISDCGSSHTPQTERISYQGDSQAFRSDMEACGKAGLARTDIQPTEPASAEDITDTDEASKVGLDGNERHATKDDPLTQNYEAERIHSPEPSRATVRVSEPSNLKSSNDVVDDAESCVTVVAEAQVQKPVHVVCKVDESAALSSSEQTKVQVVEDVGTMSFDEIQVQKAVVERADNDGIPHNVSDNKHERIENLEAKQAQEETADVTDEGDTHSLLETDPPVPSLNDQPVKPSATPEALVDPTETSSPPTDQVQSAATTETTTELMDGGSLPTSAVTGTTNVDTEQSEPILLNTGSPESNMLSSAERATSPPHSTSADDGKGVHGEQSLDEASKPSHQQTADDSSGSCIIISEVVSLSAFSGFSQTLPHNAVSDCEDTRHSTLPNAVGEQTVCSVDNLTRISDAGSSATEHPFVILGMSESTTRPEELKSPPAKKRKLSVDTRSAEIESSVTSRVETVNENQPSADDDLVILSDTTNPTGLLPNSGAAYSAHASPHGRSSRNAEVSTEPLENLAPSGKSLSSDCDVQNIEDNDSEVQIVHERTAVDPLMNVEVTLLGSENPLVQIETLVRNQEVSNNNEEYSLSKILSDNVVGRLPRRRSSNSSPLKPMQRAPSSNMMPPPSPHQPIFIRGPFAHPGPQYPHLQPMVSVPISMAQQQPMVSVPISMMQQPPPLVQHHPVYSPAPLVQHHTVHHHPPLVQHISMHQQPTLVQHHYVQQSPLVQHTTVHHGATNHVGGQQPFVFIPMSMINVREGFGDVAPLPAPPPLTPAPNVRIPEDVLREAVGRTRSQSPPVRSRSISEIPAPDVSIIPIVKSTNPEPAARLEPSVEAISETPLVAIPLAAEESNQSQDAMVCNGCKSPVCMCRGSLARIALMKEGVGETTPMGHPSPVKEKTPSKLPGYAPPVLQNAASPSLQYASRDMFSPGELFWTCLSGSPYWPSVVTDDPGTGQYWREGSGKGPHVHVNFLNDMGRRSWVFAKTALRFEGKDKFQEKAGVIKYELTKRKRSKTCVNIQPRYKEAWEQAVEQAESIMNTDRQGRLQFVQNQVNSFANGKKRSQSSVSDRSDSSASSALAANKSRSRAPSGQSEGKQESETTNPIVKAEPLDLPSQDASPTDSTKKKATRPPPGLIPLFPGGSPTPETTRSTRVSLNITPGVASNMPKLEERKPKVTTSFSVTDRQTYVQKQEIQLNSSVTVTPVNKNRNSLDDLNLKFKGNVSIFPKPAKSSDISVTVQSTIKVSTPSSSGLNQVLPTITATCSLEPVLTSGPPLLIELSDDDSNEPVPSSKAGNSKPEWKVKQDKKSPCKLVLRKAEDGASAGKTKKGTVWTPTPIGSRVKTAGIPTLASTKVKQSTPARKRGEDTPTRKGKDETPTPLSTPSISRSVSVESRLSDISTASSKATKRKALDSDQEERRVRRRREVVCIKCLESKPADFIKCKGFCQGSYHPECEPTLRTKEKCKACLTGALLCFVCQKAPGAKKCNQNGCSRYYHAECLSVWPQAKHVGGNFVCPLHVCHTCRADDDSVTFTPNDKLQKCIQCPTAYHTGDSCLAAGSECYSNSVIRCSKHLDSSSLGLKHTSAPWCFICAKGGSLICCEYCPSSFHVECLQITTPEGSFSCLDCESGRLPLYHDIVWVKLGNYRWWPAQIRKPEEIPDNIENLAHGCGQFCVQFFGTHDYYWVNRGRCFFYQEDDTACKNSSRARLQKGFEKAITEAAIAYKKHVDRRQEIQQEKCLKSEQKPPPYVKIKMNRPVGNVKVYECEDPDFLTPCECDPSAEHPCGEDSQCINRLTLVECHVKVCKAGTRCENQRFARRHYPKILPLRTPGRGWGLRSQEEIKKGTFICEYVGELIDSSEYLRRIEEKRKNRDDEHYFLTLDNTRIIDAGPKGNLARFMNHSCNPNCKTEKWTVNGDTRVGLFAIEDLPSGAELTFNYQFESLAGGEKKPCLCGAVNCGGYIGAKVKNLKDPKGENRKSGKAEKKKKKIKEKKPEEDDCFRCGDGGDLVLCDVKNCPKAYHLSCLGLTVLPGGSWMCPWHHCDDCGSRATKYCKTCPNSFCARHAQPTNIRFDQSENGFICNEHFDDTSEIVDIVTQSGEDTDHVVG